MSISKDEICALILASLPNAQVSVSPMSQNDTNHYYVEVTDPQFAHMSVLKQHKIVKDSLKTVISSGALHAVSIKTKPANIIL